MYPTIDPNFGHANAASVIILLPGVRFVPQCGCYSRCQLTHLKMARGKLNMQRRNKIRIQESKNPRNVMNFKSQLLGPQKKSNWEG